MSDEQYLECIKGLFAKNSIMVRTSGETAVVVVNNYEVLRFDCLEMSDDVLADNLIILLESFLREHSSLYFLDNSKTDTMIIDARAIQKNHRTYYEEILK